MTQEVRDKRGESTPLQQVEPVAALYDLEGSSAGSGDPVARALDATVRYAGFYHDAAPFSREALAALWRSCRDADPQRCAAARARVARRLGEVNGNRLPGADARLDQAGEPGGA